MPKKPDSPGAGVPRRRRSADVARKEILDAAQRRLADGGPDAIRLAEIAADVGIAHPTILHHFGNREGLLRALDTRAIRALTDDIDGMIRSASAPASPVELVERVAETMDQQGLARLIAWWAMRDREAEAIDDIEPAALIQEISARIRERLSEVEAFGPAEPEAISFSVRLAVIAMFGDALIGDIMSPVEASEREAEQHRFRQWLAEILLESRRKGPADNPS